MVAISIQNAQLNYNGQALLDNLSFEIPAGQWTCVLGASGIGKTSLLRRIAGLETWPADIQTSDGQPLPPRIAYLAQTDALMPWLSALDNVLLGAKLRGERLITQSALDLLRQVGLSGKENEPPTRLSGGQRQRVALARTLIEDKPIILMDEPFSAVDMPTRYHLQGLAAQLLHNRTVLLVTHDPWEALRLGHQIIILAGSPARIVWRQELNEPLPRNLTDPILTRHYENLISILLSHTGSP